ncbi:ER membrane protein complex subunit 1, partial [Tetrabaena socialis]
QVACSLELYDATPGREFSVLDYLFNPNSTRAVSSFDPAPLEVLSQVFFSRLVPVAGGTTRTEQGITAKQLLLVTNTDQVYALDRRWVDPRRPRKQKLTQDEMEEGLVPYQDTLPLAPLSFATLDKQVLGARGVLVEPTRLESTCLLLVQGVDLFYTRLSPAKGFDSLEDDFNYVLLLLALAGLLAGSGALQYLSKQSALKQKWK